MPDIQIQTLIFYNEETKKFIAEGGTSSGVKPILGKLIAHLKHATEAEAQSAYDNNVVPFLNYCATLFKQDFDDEFDDIEVNPEEHDSRHKKAFTGFFSDLYRNKLEAIRPGCFEKLCTLMPNAESDKAVVDYLGWACELVLNNQLRKEDYPKLAAYLKAYNNGGEDDPIYCWTDLSLETFPNLPSLYREIDGAIPAEDVIEQKLTGSKREELIERGEIHVVYDAPELKIYTPFTETASQVLGTGTEWCIAYTKSPCHFDDYNKKGRFLILFPANEPPIAVHFATYEFRDYTDDMIDLGNLLTRFPILSHIGAWYLDNKQRDAADFLLSPNPTPRITFQAASINPSVVAKSLRFGDPNGKPFQDFVTSIDPTRGIGRHYSNIRHLPDASPDLQLLALQGAQEVLGRIKTVMPDELAKSTASAVKSFSGLRSPIIEVTQWLAANRPSSLSETADVIVSEACHL